MDLAASGEPLNDIINRTSCKYVRERERARVALWDERQGHWVRLARPRGQPEN
ncbi:hypothetical protein J6590_073033 [Homalodisca vitripennis]|nr:hypothetical protein J6590_073033 [Homalodisca vitripennis]